MQENSFYNSTENMNSQEDFPMLIRSYESETIKHMDGEKCYCSKLNCYIKHMSVNYITLAESNNSNTENENKRGKKSKIDFKNEVPDVLTVNWDCTI